jgi:hypothetical protein
VTDPVEDPIGEVAARLCVGAIVAVKGIGGFHLAADAALCLLRPRRRRAPGIHRQCRHCNRHRQHSSQQQQRHQLLLRARNSFLTVGVVAAAIERPRVFRSAAAELSRACVLVLSAADAASNEAIQSAGISHPVLKVRVDTIPLCLVIFMDVWCI